MEVSDPNPIVYPPIAYNSASATPVTIVNGYTDIFTNNLDTECVVQSCELMTAGLGGIILTLCTSPFPT